MGRLRPQMVRIDCPFYEMSMSYPDYKSHTQFKTIEFENLIFLPFEILIFIAEIKG
jgi:hypothetical protein